ncbi:Calcium-dependent phospholipid-binding Copine family protein [Perilla frutescens var. hirtella]|nr:Calcium-dependent phospholipid-binding Copine family protein [Perilla frutescens var. frutescens]KAH6800591.1 Calcium-dependent phospholipid-binding Copine family protein [Perilla frutescens var. hirtella]
MVNLQTLKLKDQDFFGEASCVVSDVIECLDFNNNGSHVQIRKLQTSVAELEALHQSRAEGTVPCVRTENQSLSSNNLYINGPDLNIGGRECVVPEGTIPCVRTENQSLSSNNLYINGPDLKISTSMA